MQKILMALLLIAVAVAMTASAHAFFGSKFKKLKPQNNMLSIPVKKVDDGSAHYFKVMADDGVPVDFFVIKSRDGIIRAAIDSCDVCYRSGKGYIQKGDFMICTNCGRRFATDRINEVQGGCNPAPLKREIKEDAVVITMADINQNSWYCKFK